MNLELNEERRALQDTVRRFAQNEILPRVAEDEEEHLFQKDLVRKMGELGFFGLPPKAASYLSSYKKPTSVTFLDSLPKTQFGGKVLKRHKSASH